jgi:hypothetical protein
MEGRSDIFFPFKNSFMAFRADFPDVIRFSALRGSLDSFHQPLVVVGLGLEACLAETDGVVIHFAIL